MDKSLLLELRKQSIQFMYNIVYKYTLSVYIGANYDGRIITKTFV